MQKRKLKIKKILKVYKKNKGNPKVLRNNKFNCRSSKEKFHYI